MTTKYAGIWFLVRLVALLGISVLVAMESGIVTGAAIFFLYLGSDVDRETINLLLEMKKDELESDSRKLKEGS